jgi:hypothetical protein
VVCGQTRHVLNLLAFWRQQGSLQWCISCQELTLLTDKEIVALRMLNAWNKITYKNEITLEKHNLKWLKLTTNKKKTHVLNDVHCAINLQQRKKQVHLMNKFGPSCVYCVGFTVVMENIDTNPMLIYVQCSFCIMNILNSTKIHSLYL